MDELKKYLDQIRLAKECSIKAQAEIDDVIDSLNELLIACDTCPQCHERIKSPYERETLHEEGLCSSCITFNDEEESFRKSWGA